MKQVVACIVFATLLMGCDNEEESINPDVLAIQGTYVGTLREVTGAPLVEIQVKAGPKNTVVISFEHNSETGLVELIGRDVVVKKFSGHYYVMWNIGEQTSGLKAKYTYVGRRSNWAVALPAREGEIDIHDNGERRLIMAADVTTDDNRKYQMIMDAKNK